MNNYWRMMEQVTLSDQEKEKIMDMLENKQPQKRRMPRAGKLILAAALAVGCVLSIAAGLPAQVYNFMSGSTVVLDDSGTGEVKIGMSGEDPTAPVTLADNRLWFEADGQKLDVTDKVDENTPYIYEHTDPATGNKGYVIVGGTADHFGWAEIFETESGAGSLTGFDYEDTYLTINGVRQPSYQMTPELVEKLNNDPGYKLDTVKRPWFQAALDQLGLDW